MTLGMAATELRHAREGIVRKIENWQFIPVPPDKVNYCDQEHLFGEAVYERCPDAQQDVKDAGDCIAVGLPTAAVFHLMRVAEHGLWALAIRIRVRLMDKGAIQRIEYAD